MKTEERYNGWTNYETWAVALWLSNDEPLYNLVRQMTADAWRDAPEDENTGDGIWTVQQTATFRLADEVKRLVTEDIMPDLGASLAADLLGAALSEVDWCEIAESWLQDNVDEYSQTAEVAAR